MNILRYKLKDISNLSILNIGVGKTFGPYIDGKNFTIAKVIGTKSWPDSASVRHILIATVNPQSGQLIRPDSIAKKLADSIKLAVAGGADFNALVQKYSDDQGSKAKGGVYDYFAQGQMVGAFNDFSFDNPVGAKAVVKTDFGYHYMEVLKQTAKGPAYKIAYFSRTVEPSDETISAASTAAAQFAAESRNAKQFEAAVTSKKLVPRVAEVRPNDYTIIGLGSARSLIKWVYENKVGNVSEPTNLGDKFIVALIAESKEEGLPDAKTARIQVESIIRNQKKAAEIIGKIGNNRDLGAIATAFKTNVLNADSISYFSPFIPGVGMEPKLTGAAFNPAVKGKVSEPIPGNSAVYVINTTNVGLMPAGNADYSGRRMQMEQGMKQNGPNAALQALTKAATVKDRRIKFY